MSNFNVIGFGVLGAITGFSLNNMLFSIFTENANTIYVYICGVVFAVLFCIVSIVTVNYIDQWLGLYLDELEKVMNSLTLQEIGETALGILGGVLLANLLAIPFYRMNYFGITCIFLLNIYLAYFGGSIVTTKIKEARQRNVNRHILIDTSAIIDGRIIDVYKTGFIEKNMVVPDCVVDELQKLADSSDSMKRSKGKRGLDIMKNMKNLFQDKLEVKKFEYTAKGGVDDKLIELCRSGNSILLTVDYNLNQAAKLRGITVFNINELSSALKPVSLPGESLTVNVMKEGKEKEQGIGYLEDGTMIIVEDGRRYIGKSISIMVTSSIQTDAGRLIFGRVQVGVGV